jgi:hypothetical protein
MRRRLLLFSFLSVLLEGLFLQGLQTDSEPEMVANVADVGAGLALAFGPDDVAHLVWYNAVGYTLMYLHADGISQPHALEFVRRVANPFLPTIGLDVDDQGDTHISFFSYRNGFQMRHIHGRFPGFLAPQRVARRGPNTRELDSAENSIHRGIMVT